MVDDSEEAEILRWSIYMNVSLSRCSVNKSPKQKIIKNGLPGPAAFLLLRKNPQQTVLKSSLNFDAS